MLLSDEAKDRVIILIKEDKYDEALEEFSKLVEDLKRSEYEEPIFGPNGY